MKDYLILSEQFYSIQGEGKSAGHPAVFLRLAACNLTCSGFSYQNPVNDTHLGCDTAHVWRQGERWSFEKILVHWAQESWFDHLKQGAHLVLTGGEPLIQQSALINFINTLDLQTQPYIEIETNATLKFEPEFLVRIDQINASPKLNFAGDPKTKRYQPEVLEQLAQAPQTYFKFVINDPKQIDEIFNNYIDPYQIKHEKIYLMPEGGTSEILHRHSPMVVELCKQYHFNYSPRLHIDIWGETTGV